VSDQAPDVQTVIVTDIRMPFWSMVVLLVKLVIAAIPAMVILMLIGIFTFITLGELLWRHFWH
jgi:hypothetical protein